MNGDAAIREALASLSRALCSAGLPFAVIGGIAAIVRGVPRHTNDIDIAADGGDVDVSALLGQLRGEGVVPRIDNAVEFAQENQVLLLVHSDSATPIDLSLAWLPFEQEAIASAEMVAVGSVEIPVVRTEHLIVYKAIAWRERDKEDIRRLVNLAEEAIDWHTVLPAIAELAQAMEAPERVDELKALLGLV